MFARLHRGRWVDRGGTAALTPRVERMLAEAGKRMLKGHRMRVWCLDIEGGRTISVEIYLTAGGEMANWLGGFDGEFGAIQPAIQNVLNALECSVGEGVQRFNYGPGGQEFKYRIAKAEETLETALIVPRGRGSFGAHARLLPGRVRRATVAGIPDQWRGCLRRAANLGKR